MKGFSQYTMHCVWRHCCVRSQAATCSRWAGPDPATCAWWSLSASACWCSCGSTAPPGRPGAQCPRTTSSTASSSCAWVMSLWRHSITYMYMQPRTRQWRSFKRIHAKPNMLSQFYCTSKEADCVEKTHLHTSTCVHVPVHVHAHAHTQSHVHVHVHDLCICTCILGTVYGSEIRISTRSGVIPSAQVNHWTQYPLPTVASKLNSPDNECASWASYFRTPLIF